MSGGQYAALAYGVVFVFVLVYVAIIAAKLQRLQRQTVELLGDLRATAAGRGHDRSSVSAGAVPSPSTASEEAK